MPEIIFRYFQFLSPDQKNKFSSLKSLYDYWNRMINVISRKDMDNFYCHHVLHSLSIAKVISFSDGTRVIDVGTGGGFPGIPLAILFPRTEFILMDSIGKKIKVVNSVAGELKLDNVVALAKRAEEEKGKFDFVVSRAVTDFRKFVKLTRKNISSTGINQLKNGIFYLKGGDMEDEISIYKNQVNVWNISNFFSEPFFETKKIVYLPV